MRAPGRNEVLKATGEGGREKRGEKTSSVLIIFCVFFHQHTHTGYKGPKKGGMRTALLLEKKRGRQKMARIPFWGPNPEVKGASTSVE